MASRSLQSPVKSLELLRARYGTPHGPPTSDLFGLLIWENVAYLASPERRRKAFARLKDSIGITPEDIASADGDLLKDVAAHGILKETTVSKLRRCARLAMEKYGGRMESLLNESVEEAIRQLKAFPSIGLPGAERILLFAGKLKKIAPDSNGVRVLARLGMIEEQSYARMYQATRALDLRPRDGSRQYQQAHLTLQTHGRELCRRDNPKCGACPLEGQCMYARQRKARGDGVPPGPS